jgi:HTH-type transcriptional regulator / antitoxin HigA
VEKEKLMAIKTDRGVFDGGIPDSYSGLCAIHLPRPIHDDVDYANTMEIIDALAGLPLNADQEDYLEALSTFVETFDKQRTPAPPKFSGREMLQTVCEETNTTQATIAQILGVSESLVSLMFAGERQITVDNAKKLAKHFGVGTELFLDL